MKNQKSKPIARVVATGTALAATVLLLMAAEASGQPLPESVTTDAGTIRADKVAPLFKRPGYSPYAHRNFPTRVLWGEMHLHTSYSPDAGAAGTRIGPEDALRFAHGAEITSSTGQPVKLARPLDWVAISDHSDALGVVTELIAGNPKLMADPVARRWSTMMNAGGEEAMKAVMEMITAQGQGKVPPVLADPQLSFDAWRKLTAIVEKYNEPGRFTTLMAYEWTSNSGGGNNLHRNVIYKDGKDKADRMAPLTTFVTENPEELWKWMQEYEAKTGGEVIAIPHNGNLSNGLMFALTTFKGKAPTKGWADTRAKYEPLYEITQVKGTSEQHPSLAPSDEFAAFEIWDQGNLNVKPKTPGMLNYEYAREALKNGLALDSTLGANPFKFGFVGSTDSHTGLTTGDENNFFGKFPIEEPSPERWDLNAFDFEGRVIKGWQLGATGYTGIWATENTREALWDAMKRREVYATSGPRITVRFFGGFDFVPDDALSREPGAVGYEKGVPMGAELQSAPAGKRPSFLVAAMKDPLSGNLDRIQIVKGWLDAAGKTHEKIYDVAWADDENRKPDGDGKLPPVGNTVDLKTATWKNTIGDPELATVWVDPDFDPKQRAFYYVRVLEIPTPRWTLYDAVRFKVEMSPEVPMTVQERAYASPIWYRPG
jgi:hypothetical protein